MTQRSKSTSVGSTQNAAFLNKKMSYCYSLCLSKNLFKKKGEKRKWIVHYMYENQEQTQVVLTAQLSFTVRTGGSTTARCPTEGGQCVVQL